MKIATIHYLTAYGFGSQARQIGTRAYRSTGVVFFAFAKARQRRIAALDAAVQPPVEQGLPKVPLAQP
jgi:hypothetical protein